jgi:hypothetical protein
MKYMLLIYSEPGAEGAETEAEQEAIMGEWFAFTQRIVDSGEMVAGDPLQGVETAVTVSVRNGETVVTDGPFAETKEILGGYYLVDVDSQARAEELGAQLPSARYGRTEIRPLMVLPGADG